jgi:hypothetical protein
MGIDGDIRAFDKALKKYNDICKGSFVSDNITHPPHYIRLKIIEYL